MRACARSKVMALLEHIIYDLSSRDGTPKPWLRLGKLLTPNSKLQINPKNQIAKPLRPTTAGSPFATGMTGRGDRLDLRLVSKRDRLHGDDEVGYRFLRTKL